MVGLADDLYLAMSCGEGYGYDLWWGAGTTIYGGVLGLRFMEGCWDYDLWWGAGTTIYGGVLGLRFKVRLRQIYGEGRSEG